MNNSLNLFCKELQKGNGKVFGQLFTDFYVNLCRFAYTFVKDRDLAEEIVQEVFINLWEQREKVNITTSVRSFLYTSVKNRALNYIRDEKIRTGHENEFALEQSSKISHIIDFCQKEELNQLLNEAIEELPSQCRQIFELSRNKNLTYNEIAQKMNISPKTVENQMSIALKKLRIKLAPYLTSVIAFF